MGLIFGVDRTNASGKPRRFFGQELPGGRSAGAPGKTVRRLLNNNQPAGASHKPTPSGWRPTRSEGVEERGAWGSNGAAARPSAAPTATGPAPRPGVLGERAGPWRPRATSPNWFFVDDIEFTVTVVTRAPGALHRPNSKFAYLCYVFFRHQN